MEPFAVVLTASAEKDLRGLDRTTLRRVIAAIQTFAHNPFPAGAIKLTDADRLYRVRVGQYRVIYEVEPAEGIITVHYRRHRRDAYRRF